MRFHIRGRTDQMLVIKGVNFFPQSLMSVIAEFPHELGSAFRVVRPQAGTVDRVDVILETALEGLPRDELSYRVQRGAQAHYFRYASAYIGRQPI